MAEAKKISSNACIPKGKKVALLKRILQQATAVEDEHKEFLKTSRYAGLPTEEEAREAEKAEKEQREAETTGADEKENTEEVKDTDAEDAEETKNSDAEGTKDTGAESADHTKKTPLSNTPEFPRTPTAKRNRSLPAVCRRALQPSTVS